jgi:membrane dipeptidase
VAFDSIADLGGLADALSLRGYSAADVEGILGGNWLRLLERALPA